MGSSTMTWRERAGVWSCSRSLAMIPRSALSYLCPWDLQLLRTFPAACTHSPFIITLRSWVNLKSGLYLY